MWFNKLSIIGKKLAKSLLLIIGSISAILFFISGILGFMSSMFYDLIYPFFNYLNNIGITDSLILIVGIISFVSMLICFTLYFKIT